MKNLFLAVMISAAFIKSFAQNVAINTTGASALDCAILDISSQDKGILIPRMTSAARLAIASPQDGLLVFDTDSRNFWFYSGSWNELISASDMGDAGGDLSGQYPEPMVSKIQGHALSALTPNDKQVLKWDSANNIWKGMNDSLTLPYITAAPGAGHVFSVTNSFNGFTNTTAIHGQRISPSGIPLDVSSAVWGDANIGTGVLGTSNYHPGVYGKSLQANGVEGYAVGVGKAGVFGYSAATNGAGVRGISQLHSGVEGITSASNRGGVYGKTNAIHQGIGVLGETLVTDTMGIGVYGKSYANNVDKGGVVGWNGKPGGIGANGRAPFGIGVYGFNQTVDHPAIYGRNQSGGKAIYAYSSEYDGNEELTPMGVHGHVYTAEATGYGILGTISGPGDGVRGYAGSGGSGIAGYDQEDNFGKAAHFETTNDVNYYPTLFLRNAGTGSSLFIDITSTTVYQPALVVHNSSASNDYAVFENGEGANKIRFDNTGKGFFNGGTQTGGADIAEVFEVENEITEYEPGDVLAISIEKDRTVTKSFGAYSTLVAGVYATKPGVLMTEEHIDADLSGKVPMGVVGVIPTKVCLEGGEIRRGDLLVTSSVPGVAMKGDPEKIRTGQVLGKALENYTSDEIGLIRVLVNVK